MQHVVSKALALSSGASGPVSQLCFLKTLWIPLLVCSLPTCCAVRLFFSLGTGEKSRQDSYLIISFLLQLWQIFRVQRWWSHLHSILSQNSFKINPLLNVSPLFSFTNIPLLKLCHSSNMAVYIHIVLSFHPGKRNSSL